MDGSTVAILAFFALFALLAIRVPIGVSMLLVGIVGFAVIVGPMPAVRLLAQSPIRTATNEVFGVVPMFILMGTFAASSGLSRELFQASSSWFGHKKGGLGAATILACGGFAAISGSSVASAATMGKVALPEMRRLGYDPRFASGTIAAGGTLGILIPPSVVLALYGILVEQDIGILFIAGIVPGLLAMLLYIFVIWVLTKKNPNVAPSLGDAFNLKAAIVSLKGIWATLTLFVFVIGGIYGGLFTPTEAAAMGAGGAFIICLFRGTLNRKTTMEALVDAAKTTGSIFVICIGAIIFGYFLAVTRAPQSLAKWVVGFDLPPIGVLCLILIIYFVLGAFLDALAIIVLTVPIVYPIITGLGYDPIWFGVVLVMVVELGLITPPYGMNVFVLKSVAPDLGLGQIFRGVMPFVGAGVFRLALIIAFPIIVLYLPSLMG